MLGGIIHCTFWVEVLPPQPKERVEGLNTSLSHRLVVNRFQNSTLLGQSQALRVYSALADCLKHYQDGVIDKRYCCLVDSVQYRHTLDQQMESHCKRIGIENQIQTGRIPLDNKNEL